MELVEGESLADVITRIGVGGMLEWESVLRAGRRHLPSPGSRPRAQGRPSQHHAEQYPDSVEGPRCQAVRHDAGQGSKARWPSRSRGPARLSASSPTCRRSRRPGQAEIDCRSDIYNLGATCYRLLTGHTPAEGSNAAETILKVQNTVPPSRRSTSFDSPVIRGGRDDDAGEKPRRAQLRAQPRSSRSEAHREIPGADGRVMPRAGRAAQRLQALLARGPAIFAN